MEDRVKSSDTPIIVNDDSTSDKEDESSSVNVTAQQETETVSHSESSSETQIKLLSDSEVALKHRNNKQPSDSEIALRNLQNKLKEVQSKLNLNTPVKSKPTENNDKGALSDVRKEDINSASSNESLESDKTANIGTLKALKLNVDSAVQNATGEKGNTGNVMTPQNEKQVAEAWNLLGLQRCKICKFSTDDKELFKNHTTTCTPKVSVVFSNGIFTCETCDLTWTNKQAFEEHIVCHTTNDPYVCINCKKAFESRLLTEQHAKTDHPNGGSVYGLRGMKKSRKIVEELEIQGKHQFTGKLEIAPTPRNKQIPGATSRASGVVVNTGQSDEVHGAQTTQIVVDSNTVGLSGDPKSNAATNVNTGSSTPNDSIDKNNELIEQNMEQLRQFLISKGSLAGVSDSRGTVKDNQSSSINETGNTDAATVMQLNSSGPKHISISVNQQKSVPAVPHNVSMSGSDTGATIHYQANQNQDEHEVTKPSPDTYSSLSLGSVSQPINTPSVISTNVLNMTGPPNVVASKDLLSKETGSERVLFNPGTLNSASQHQRQYLFTEYICPPPTRPKITIPSVKSSTVVQTTVQTSIIPAVPTTVQTNTTPILLIPIPPGFNNPANSMSNVLIPIPAGNQAGHFVNNFSVPKKGPLSTSSTKPNVSGQIGQPVSHITSACTSGMPIMLNSKPQLLLTNKAFASKPTISGFTPSVQGHPLLPTVPNKATVMNSLITKSSADLNITVSSSVVNTSANSAPPIQSQKILESTSFISSTTKHPIPTVEISVLPDKTNSQQINSTQKTDSDCMQGAQFNLSKRYLFRIKPGHGFVCEACRKFTQDEVIFRRHVWDHFHTVTRSCKFCSTEKVLRKDFMNCNLVSNVVCSLVKKSTNQEKTHAKGATPEKTISVVDDEVIAISDEEDNAKKAEPVLMGTDDVIIVDEEEDATKSQDLQIKISSTYSLSDNDKQDKAKPDSVKENNSENGSIKSSRYNKTLIKETVKEKHKDINKSDQSDGANTKPSDKTTLCEKTGVVTSPSSISDNVDKNQDENERTHCEKDSSSKECTPASISRDEKHKFERRVLSSHKAFAFYMCGFDQCSFTSLNSKKYKEHLTANHSGAYNYVCCHCGLKNYTEDAHIRHVNSHANMKIFLLFNCPVRTCKYKTNLIHMFKEHLLSHKDVVMKCTYCHKSFESVEMLITHLKANLIKFVSCPHCQFKFQLKDVAAKHIKLAHPDKPRIVVVSSQIVCLERELNFYSPPLAKAMPSEQQNVTDAAGLASMASDFNATALYGTNESQAVNINQISAPTVTIPDDNSNEATDRFSNTPPPPVLTAEVTNNKETSVSETEKVSKPSGNGQKDAHSAEAPRSLMCSKCNFISWNYKLHQQHLSLHETDEPERDKRFVCMYCPKGFESLNPFKTHVSNHVGRHEFKIYGCTLCVFTTSQRYHIIDHCKDNHLGTGTYIQNTEIVVSKEASCTYCEFKSRQAEQVQLHEKVVHINPASKQSRKTEPAKQADEANSSSNQNEAEQILTESSDTNQKYRKYHCHYCMEHFKHKTDLRTHMQSSHLDIESKSFVTFKCKYCHFTSTIKTLIITHIERKHVNEQIRILRRIENVDTPKTSNNSGNDSSVKEDKTTYRCEMCNLSMDSSEKFKKHFSDKHAKDDSEQSEGKEPRHSQEKETIYIPDGNFYKEPIHCPKCSYSNKLRVNILRHIKLHPELIPARNPVETEAPPPKATARKSTSKFSPVKAGKKNLKNPFTAVKNAVRELDKNDAEYSKQLEQLSLGGDFLHNKLSACFIPLENEYKCRICHQKIAKKFVLQRHILNHLQVVFFKCHYCLKGDIEQSLLSGHIQQEHPLKPIKLDNFDMNEICNEIKDKISEQNFNDSHSLRDISDTSQNADDGRKDFGIIRMQIHEADLKDDKNGKEKSVFKCSKCDYFARNEYFLKLHRNDHINPGRKKYGCTACGYRGSTKVDVLRHLKQRHPNHPVKYTVVGNDAVDSAKVKVARSDDSIGSVKSSSTETSEANRASISETNKASVKKPKESIIRSENITISEKGVFEMKSVYKCKECGERKNSKWAMHKHFKNSKCHKPWYRCEGCAFTNPFKNAITKHAKIRHSGKKVGIIELPLSAKIRHVKFPVKQDEQILKALQGSGNAQGKSTSPTTDETESSKNRKSSDTVGSYIHTCRLCGNYRSDSLSKLQFHMNTKHQGKPLFCTECNHKTPLVKHMINHCLNVHKLENANYSLREQEDDGTEDETEAVGKAVVNKKNDKTKLSKSVDTGLKKFKCPNCDISKDSIKMLREHMPIHFDYKPFACKYCPARLQHLSNVRRHVNIGHPGKIVKYSMVKNEKIEAKLDQLVTQVLKQMELTRKQSEKAPNKASGTHIRKKANKRALDSDEEVLPPKKKSRTLIETDESSEESSEDDISGPSTVKYRVVREPGTSTKLFQCVNCDYKTDKKKSLQRHLKKHGQKRYKCCYCEYTGSCTSNVYRHIRNRHKGKEMKFVHQKHNELVSPKRRKVMDDDSSDESSSDDSVASVKTIKKMVTLKYFCNVCDYVVTGLYHFRQHLATHKEFCYLRKGTDIDSRLSCGYCSYMAVDDIDFSKHITNHLAERPYKCGHCDYSSYQRNNIQTHLTMSHPEEEEIIIDNRDTDREKVKVKQTMLVDFDPQIILKRLKYVAGECTSKHISQNINEFVTKLSPSKSNAELDNIFVKLSNDRDKCKDENDEKLLDSKATRDISTEENRIPIGHTSLLKSFELVRKVYDANHSEAESEESQKQELESTKFNLTDQSFKRPDDMISKSNEQSDEMSEEKQIVKQPDFLQTGICRRRQTGVASKGDRTDSQQEMEVGTESVLKVESNNLDNATTSVLSLGDIDPKSVSLVDKLDDETTSGLSLGDKDTEPVSLVDNLDNENTSGLSLGDTDPKSVSLVDKLDDENTSGLSLGDKDTKPVSLIDNVDDENTSGLSLGDKDTEPVSVINNLDNETTSGLSLGDKDTEPVSLVDNLDNEKTSGLSLGDIDPKSVSLVDKLDDENTSGLSLGDTDTEPVSLVDNLDNENTSGLFLGDMYPKSVSLVDKLDDENTSGLSLRDKDTEPVSLIDNLDDENTSGLSFGDIEPESVLLVNSDKDNDIVNDVAKGTECTKQWLKNEEGLNTEKIDNRKESGIKLSKEVETMDIDTVEKQSNTEISPLGESLSIKLPLMETLIGDHTQNYLRGGIISVSFDKEMNFEGVEETKGNEQLHGQLDRLGDKSEDIGMAKDTKEDHSVKCAEETKNIDTDLAECLDTDKQACSEDSILNEENHTLKTDKIEMQPIVDVLESEMSEKDKTPINSETQSFEALDESQSFEESGKLGNITDSETQNFEVYGDSQPFEYGESQPFEYEGENYILVNECSEEADDLREEGLDSKTTDETTINTQSILQSTHTENASNKSLTCTFQDESENFEQRQDTVDGESKHVSTCKSELRSTKSVLASSEATEAEKVNTDIFSETTVTTDHEMDGIKLHFDTVKSLHMVLSESHQDTEMSLDTSDIPTHSEVTGKESELPQESLLNNDNNSVNGDIKPTYVEMNNKIEHSERSKEKSNIHGGIEFKTAVVEKCDNISSLCSGAVESATEFGRDETEVPAIIDKTDISKENLSESAEHYPTARKDFTKDGLFMSEDGCGKKAEVNDHEQQSTLSESKIPVELQNDTEVEEKLTNKEINLEISELGFGEPSNDITNQRFYSDHGSYTKNNE